MNNVNHISNWLVSLDLSTMDEVLVEYTAFLASLIRPATVTFLHIVDPGPAVRRMIERFPELESKEEFDNIIRKEIHEKIGEHFDDPSVDFRVIVREGNATDTIIEVADSVDPDLVVMGKKIGYAGEGVTPRQIFNYIAASILLVPENCRYSLKNALVPVDFSEQSAKGIKTALCLIDGREGSVTAQHIYRYRARFFPYALSEQEKAEADKEVEKKKDDFVNEFDISPEVRFVLTRLSDRYHADAVYEEAIRGRADIIVVASKTKSLPALIKKDFTGELLDYAFSVPLLIQKNKERYRKLLKSLFKSGEK